MKEKIVAISDIYKENLWKPEGWYVFYCYNIYYSNGNVRTIFNRNADNIQARFYVLWNYIRKINGYSYCNSPIKLLEGCKNKCIECKYYIS